MWEKFDDIEVSCTPAFDIAERLYNKEVELSALKSISAFSAKEEATEDAVWGICKGKSSFQRYLEIYPKGKYISEVEENIWQLTNNSKDINKFTEYLTNYPNGTHVAEAEDKLWEIVKDNGKYSIYLEHYPKGKHVDEAVKMQDDQQSDEKVWQDACKFNTFESYKRYSQTYPTGLHNKEANQRIETLMKEQKESIINALSKDRNAFSLNFIKSCGITADDLRGKITDSKGNVRDEVLLSWEKTPKNLSMGKTPTEIPAGCTEVYFWGVPGSGKTCAMAAILSRARQMGCFAPRKAEGTRYMNELSTIFMPDKDNPAVCLPPASDVDTTQYLPLTLNEVIEGKKGVQTIKQHNLSVIEISGEIFECFSCDIEGIDFRSNQHKETYEQLKKYLMSDVNPKYHFFILDSKPIRDIYQERFLQNAALYFQTEGVFNSSTQGISLIVTKSDVLSPDRKEWDNRATVAAKDNFNSLVNQLKVIVGPYNGGLGLSDGTLEVIPLSIGEVYFQSLCLFDPTPATKLVNMLLEYSKVAETNNWRKKAKSFLKR